MKYDNNSLMEHAYGRKKTTLSRKEREAGLRAMEEREEAEREKRSTACKFEVGAKSAEALVRDLLMKRGVGKIIRDETGEKMIDFAARPNRQAQGEALVYGKRAEIKTGGTVNYAPRKDWNEEDIIPKAEYICFSLLKEASEALDLIEGLCDWTVILERDEFLELCEKASRKGLHGTFHITGKAGVLAFQPHPLEKLRALIREGIESGELETLEGYLLNRG